MSNIRVAQISFCQIPLDSKKPTEVGFYLKNINRLNVHAEVEEEAS